MNQTIIEPIHFSWLTFLFFIVFSENIFGYRNLRVDLYMSASTLKGFVHMQADETISKQRSGGVDPDPVIPPILEILAPNQVKYFYEWNVD